MSSTSPSAPEKNLISSSKNPPSPSSEQCEPSEPNPLSILQRYLPKVQRWIKYTDTREGRDKIYRTIQYLSKFLSHFLGGIGPFDSNWLDRCGNAFGLGRKLFRLGRTLDFITKIVLQVSKAMKESKRISLASFLTWVSYLSLSLWLLFDSLIWFMKVKLISNNKGVLFRTICLYSWVVALISNLATHFLKWIIVGFPSSTLKSWTPFLTTFFNIFLPLGYLKVVPISNGMIGFFGTLTSLLGIFQGFPKSLP